MDCNLSAVITAARSSWNSNYTIADDRWRLKQLYSLYQLIIDHRDELVASVITSSSGELEEKDIARLVTDISHHICNADKQTSIGGTAKATEIQRRPVGVSLIIGNIENPFRWMIGPLAASIAAGNVTILATPATHENPIVSLLLKHWNVYLDHDCNFLVPSLQISDLQDKQVDQVVIYDSSPDPYQNILSSPLSKFFNTLDGGSNIVIISEGKKDWTAVAHEVHNTSNQYVPLLDRLHAVFLQVGDAQELEESLKRVHSHSSGGGKITNIVMLNDLLQEGVDANLEFHLRVGKTKGNLLIIPVNSLDRAIDELARLSSTVMQMAILGPKAAELQRFAARWIPAKIMTEGSICPVALIGEPDCGSDTTFIFPLVSCSTFSRQVRVSKQTWQLPTYIPGIRATYEDLIQPLKPEPRGERIGFFTQVDYLVKGVATSIGVVVIAGIFYGVRRLQ